MPVGYIGANASGAPKDVELLVRPSSFCLHSWGLLWTLRHLRLSSINGNETKQQGHRPSLIWIKAKRLTPPEARYHDDDNLPAFSLISLVSISAAIRFASAPRVSKSSLSREKVINRAIL
jgi:hypothetical protein